MKQIINLFHTIISINRVNTIWNRVCFDHLLKTTCAQFLSLIIKVKGQMHHPFLIIEEPQAILEVTKNQKFNKILNSETLFKKILKNQKGLNQEDKITDNRCTETKNKV